MKKYFLVIQLFIISTFQVNAQSTKIDTAAVYILDRMSSIMGDLKSCSVTIMSNYDVYNQTLGLVKQSNEEHLFMSGPDRLLASLEGDKGSRYYIYNGKTFSYYSLTKNHYAQINAPSTSIAMIDSMNKNYGIIFPAADFIYPTFVDDILGETNNLELLGMTKVSGKDCYHIAGMSKGKTFQFWISEAPYYLPIKFEIIYTDKPMNPQFEEDYTDWQINPNLPDRMFEFSVPPNSKKIKLTPLSSKK